MTVGSFQKLCLLAEMRGWKVKLCAIHPAWTVVNGSRHFPMDKQSRLVRLSLVTSAAPVFKVELASCDGSLDRAADALAEQLAARGLLRSS